MEGGKDMGNIMEIFRNKVDADRCGDHIIDRCGSQVADAPPLEAVNPDNVSRYRIDDSGRILDSDGRLRGWIKGDEVYSPALQLKYRLSGRYLEDVP